MDENVDVSLSSMVHSNATSNTKSNTRATRCAAFPSTKLAYELDWSILKREEIK